MASSAYLPDTGDQGASSSRDLSFSAEEDVRAPIQALSDGEESVSSGQYYALFNSFKAFHAFPSCSGVFQPMCLHVYYF